MFPNVALNIFVSSVMMGLLRNQHQLARPTNKEALDWYKQNLKNGKVSEEATKRGAVVFFNLSEDKATISKAKFKTNTQISLNVQITSLTADIAHNERLEESESGPRQKQLKAALKKIGRCCEISRWSPTGQASAKNA